MLKTFSVVALLALASSNASAQAAKAQAYFALHDLGHGV